MQKVDAPCDTQDIIQMVDAKCDEKDLIVDAQDIDDIESSNDESQEEA